MQIRGKRIAATGKADTIAAFTHRLFLRDKKSNRNFLIDTGAAVSVLPPTPGQIPTNYHLYAANGTKIQTYGYTNLTVDLGLHRPLQWRFIIADVDKPIIGADFLASHKLLVDLHRHRIIDHTTSMSVNGSISKIPTPIIASLPLGDSKFHKLLHKYSANTKTQSEPSHSITHDIETTGRPCSARARRLAPDKYNAAKAEFQRMCKQGICRPQKPLGKPPTYRTQKGRRN